MDQVLNHAVNAIKGVALADRLDRTSLMDPISIFSFNRG